MGSGKSSNGRLLAKRLGYQFVDTDQVVMRATGMEIAEIFSKHGEAWFRDQETLALESLRGAEKKVIATGGGIVGREQNVALLKAMSFVVWMTADEETTFERVSRTKKRPLLNVENPREVIAKLFAERRPLYQAAADFVIDTSFLRRMEIAYAIIAAAERGRKSG